MPRFSRRFSRQADLLARAKRLASNLDDNAEDLSGRGLDPSFQAKLEEKLARASELDHEHAALTAKKQEVYVELRQTLEEIARLTSFLEAALKEMYGTRSESLAGFGVQPYRPQPFRARKKRAAKPADPAPDPTVPSPDGSTPSS